VALLKVRKVMIQGSALCDLALAVDALPPSMLEEPSDE
jgi:hypothetical protein